MEEKSNKISGSRVREVRKGLGMKQREFAEALDISEKYMSMIETGARDLSSRKAIAISNLVGGNVTAAWLMGETDFRNASEKAIAKSEHLTNVFGKVLQREVLVDDLIRAHGYDLIYKGSSVVIGKADGKNLEISLDEFRILRNRINDFVHGLLLVEFEKAETKRAFENVPVGFADMTKDKKTASEE